MRKVIDGLVELCKEQPFDTERIADFIKSNDMSSEEVTRAAIGVAEYGAFSYSDYLYDYEKEPQPSELRTYGWDRLFKVLIDNGLDASLVFCDDGRNYENILLSLKYFDDGDLGARILRDVLAKGYSPNIIIDDCSFFEDVDDNLIIDIHMGLYPHEWQVGKAIRFWLVLVGFGGLCKDGKLPVDFCGDYRPEIFKDFERFDYEIIYTKSDFELKITEKETGVTVAVV